MRPPMRELRYVLAKGAMIRSVRVLLRNRDLSSISGHLWVSSLRAASLARSGAMAAYAHADIPSQLLPRLGGLLAELEKDGKATIS